jgi:hypothetical protein
MKEYKLLFFSIAILLSAYSNAQEYDPNKLYPYIIDPKPDNTQIMAEVVHYKTGPPLRPERFRRKVKMLWGIDIKDYPENAWIRLDSQGRDFYLSIKHQIMPEWHIPDYEYPFNIPLHQFEEFYPLRKYLFYHDEKAFQELDNFSIDSYEGAAGKLDPKYVDSQIMAYANILLILHQNIVFQTPPLLLDYIDRHKHYGEDFGLYSLSYFRKNDESYARTSDIRLDMLSLYLSRELAKGRKILSKTESWSHNQDTGKIWLGFHIDREENDPLSSSFIRKIANYFREDPMPNPWCNYRNERGVASFLTFMLRLQNKIQNKTVIQFMSGELSGMTDTSDWRDAIRANNYYGYAVLREFCENPEREMPTLEKVGTSFSARVVNPEALLYLEPFPDSYDIDTLLSTEIFKVYEMGYDDYYLVEVVKPVESPVAGPDGYAMILDRTETIYGYVRKSEVREVTKAKINLPDIHKR